MKVTVTQRPKTVTIHFDDDGEAQSYQLTADEARKLANDLLTEIGDKLHSDPLTELEKRLKEVPAPPYAPMPTPIAPQNPHWPTYPPNPNDPHCPQVWCHNQP